MDQQRTRARLEAPYAEGMTQGMRGGAAAVIGTRVDTDQTRPLGLSWEVCEEGGRDPVRYGLCLARPQEDFRVRVPVLGLVPGRDYRFQFQLDSQTAVSGRFHTDAAHHAPPLSPNLAA